MGDILACEVNLCVDCWDNGNTYPIYLEIGLGMCVSLFLTSHLSYAPWCGHCKRLAPTWDELAAKGAGSYKVAKVDCTTETKVCAEYGVKGYPTLHFFGNGAKVGDRYGGQRTLDALHDYAKGQAK